MAPSTIGRGLKELAQDEPLERVRRPGAGRKPAIVKSLPSRKRGTRPCLAISMRWSNQRAAAIPNRCCGGPARACCIWPRHRSSWGTRRAAPWWPSCSTRRATACKATARPRKATAILTGTPNSPTSTQVSAALPEKQPVISVDTKKKELVGDFRNNGREYRPQGNPEEVRVHDFLIKELGRAVPYGIYDLAANSGWVSVGVDHDTAAFAINSIRQWWLTVGRARYPEATRLLITADGGGSNGSRVRLRKRELQTLANQLGLDITVSHLPPGTSKWNKIEHRLFSFISQNWRAQPLVSYRVIVELISATTTKTGLTVRCELDTGQYPKGIVVSDAEMAALNVKPAEFHGEWNYTISPNTDPPNGAFIS